ncbi:hypothetical protein [Selenomonas sp. FC4001]|uniref:hypothetical protein n=1 Tax=Selenomonas sp. FC4001 TaxID=1408313 RepID=UPI00055C3E39|nr:hypothetical protein [Selenomonas sp. FC4001]
MNEKYYDIHDIKMTGGDWLYLAGVGIFCVLGAYVVKVIRDDKKDREKKEKALWNDGICPKCGNKWHYRHFYPAGSRGQYQHVNIKCHKCKVEATLEEIDIPNKYSAIYL